MNRNIHLACGRSDDDGDDDDSIFSIQRKRELRRKNSDPLCWSGFFGCHDGGCYKQGGLCTNLGSRMSPDCVCSFSCPASTSFSGCLDGDMQLETLSRGRVKISSLKEGEFIRGVKTTITTPSWCNITAIFPVIGNASTFGGFTPDHFIVFDKNVNGTSNGFNDANTFVSGAGKKGYEKIGPIYTLVTDCDAAYNSNGQLFTPISSTFCPAISWSDYLPIMAAIRQVMAKIGPEGKFLFNLDVYYNNPSDPNYPNFKDALPKLCAATLQCSRDNDCDNFESGWSQFFQLHLKPTQLQVLQQVFPNMGLSGQLDGTLTAAVTAARNMNLTNSNQVTLLIEVGGSIALLSFVVVCFLWRKLKQFGSKKAIVVAEKADKEGEDIEMVANDMK